MIKIKRAILALVISIGFFFLGKYSTPTKVEIKEVEKIVYKESTSLKTNIDRDFDKTITEKPDGTKITEIKTKTVRTSESEKNKDLNSEVSKSNVIINRPQYRLNLSYVPKFINPNEYYRLGIDIRIVSELYVGINFTTEARPQLGFNLSLGL